jgi:HD-like signal output (HDOD) protein
MSFVSQDPVEVADTFALARARLQRHLDTQALAIPLLPDVAVRVVRIGTAKTANAQLLADIIAADATLAMYVLRIVASPAKRAATPIVSLQHAVAWLGIDEVANIAFTLALQGKLLHVKGQHRRARRLWRHSLASALWARQLAHRLCRDTGTSYLCGLLHNIGKVVTLGTINDAIDDMQLASDDYDRLIEHCYRDIGSAVLSAWSLPPPVPLVLAHWEDYAAAGDLQWQANVVNLAHKLADHPLHEPCMLKRDDLMADAAYRDLGFTRKDGEAIFDLGRELNAELDRYLSP